MATSWRTAGTNLRGLVRRREGVADRKWFVVILLAVGIRLFFLVFWPQFAYEDALITFRYAENLVKGLGFVYNPGERVLGTTAPLYGLILAVFRALTHDMFVGSALFNVSSDALLIYLIAGNLLRPGEEDPAWGPGLITGFLVASYFPFIRMSISRMETSLYVLLFFLSLWLLSRKSYALLGGTLGFLTMVRLDGFALVTVIFLWLLWKERSGLWRALLAFMCVFGLYVVVATFYYGSPVPQSVVAKSHIYPRVFSGQRSRLQSLLMVGRYVFLGNAFHRGVFLPFFVIGVYGFYRRRSVWGTLLVVWFLIYMGALGLANTFVHEWYLDPLLLVYMVTAGVGMAVAYRAGIARAARWRSLYRWGMLVLAVAFLMVNVTVAYYKTYWQYRFELESRLPIGLWLHEQGGPAISVMLEPIGYIGYYSQARIYDVMGLVTPEALSYFDAYGVDNYILAWATRALPDFVVLRTYEFESAAPQWRENFLDAYALRKRVRAYNKVAHRDVTFYIFQRRTYTARAAQRVREP